MKKCPRFDGCSIPRCPLDFWMKNRMELPEDEKCILIASRGKRVSGNIRGNLKRIIGRFVWNQNRSGNIPLPPYVSGVKGSLTNKRAKIRQTKATKS